MRKPLLDKETLVELYIKQKRTIKEICEITGVKSPITVAKYMKKYGIQTRDPNKENNHIYKLGLSIEEHKSLLWKWYIDEKLSINKIAKKLGVTSVVIRRALKKYGIPLRNQKESVKASCSGPNNPKWKGGIARHSDGYILVYCPDHPNADPRGYVYEHRLVMEKHIGRYLKSDEHIHHINGDKTDNRIENLMIVTNSEHAKLHSQQRKREKASK